MKKVTKPASTTTAAKPSPKPVKKTSGSPKPPANPIAPAATATPAPAVKTAAPTPATTTLVAHIDVGFGSTLYIRGEGPGLSWEKGVPLNCVADDRWSITLHGATNPIVFKFLVNDITWCSGDDFVAQPGATVTVTPVF